MTLQNNMISSEPIISVGIIRPGQWSSRRTVEKFRLIDDVIVFGEFMQSDHNEVVLYVDKI